MTGKAGRERVVWDRIGREMKGKDRGRGERTGRSGVDRAVRGQKGQEAKRRDRQDREGIVGIGSGVGGVERREWSGQDDMGCD